VKAIIDAINSVSVSPPTKLPVERVYYRFNEARLKPAGLQHASHLPRKEQIKAFKQFISDSYRRESDEYRAEMLAERDRLYQAEVKAYKDRKNWDGSDIAMNRYKFSMFPFTFTPDLTQLVALLRAFATYSA
jgi:hypothetical protein